MARHAPPLETQGPRTRTRSESQVLEWMACRPKVSWATNVPSHLRGFTRLPHASMRPSFLPSILYAFPASYVSAGAPFHPPAMQRTSSLPPRGMHRLPRLPRSDTRAVSKGSRRSFFSTRKSTSGGRARTTRWSCDRTHVGSSETRCARHAGGKEVRKKLNTSGKKPGGCVAPNSRPATLAKWKRGSTKESNVWNWRCITTSPIRGCTTNQTAVGWCSNAPSTLRNCQVPKMETNKTTTGRWPTPRENPCEKHERDWPGGTKK